METKTISARIDKYEVEHCAEMRAYYPHMRTDSQLVRYCIALAFQHMRDEQRMSGSLDTSKNGR